MPPRAGDPTGVQTGIILNTNDRSALSRRFRIGAVELVGPVPPIFWFRDPDGNMLLFVEVS